MQNQFMESNLKKAETEALLTYIHLTHIDITR